MKLKLPKGDDDLLKSMNKEKINIIIDVQKFITSIDLTSQNQIMSPGKSAMLLSNQFSTIFSELKQ